MFHCPSCGSRYPLLTYDGCCLQLQCFGEPLQQGAGEGTGPVVDPVEVFDTAWALWNGQDEERNASEALRLFREAAERGHVQAQYNLGVLYATGSEIAPDQFEAVRWYRIAAERGHGDAQNNLGLMYDNGSGVEQDATEAVRWYRASAEQGNANAQSNLGWMYANGRGTSQDAAEAIRWSQLAAEQGNTQATVNLAQWASHDRAAQSAWDGNLNRDPVILGDFDARVCRAIRSFKPTLTMG